ncbi:MAG: VWA domain-containing protein [Acidobacteriota bacterium]|nr:VWA domain-containing protein [Acidobacteriota bacterium]
MRRLLFVIALFCTSGVLHAQKLGPVDWIFLVDTSKSMRGAGGTKDIFNDVKASIDAFVSEANRGDTVAIFTFDRDVRLHSSMTISAAARADLNSIVHSLEAEGNRTHLGAAIAEGLGRAESLRVRKDPARSRAVVLFTDGKEDVKGIENPIRIDSNIPRAGDAFIFFVSMGAHEPQLDAFASATPRTTVLKAPNAEAIRRVAREIRAKIPAPIPTPVIVTIEPSIIAFGNVDAGEQSEAREITLTSNRATRVSLTLANANGITMPAQSDIAVDPKTPAKVSIRLVVAEEAPPGPQRLLLQAPHARPAAITIDVIPPSLLERVLQALAALAVLLLIAFVFVQQQRKKNRLEGELEILRPRPAPDAAFVGLPKLQASEVNLSSILPIDVLGGSDARLFVQRKAGKKKVWISAQSGTLRINDVETPMSDLYDADTIEIGDAKLRFNRVGDERPLEADYANQEGSL